jgi:hypothetical protein
MADFAETIIDERAGRRLLQAIQGKGPSVGSKTDRRQFAVVRPTHVKSVALLPRAADN